MHPITQSENKINAIVFILIPAVVFVYISEMNMVYESFTIVHDWFYYMVPKQTQRRIYIYS